MISAYFFIILLLTIGFSFVPEQFIAPKAPKWSCIFTQKKWLILQCLLVTLLFLGVTLIVQRALFAGLAVSIFLIILSGVSNAKYKALREPLVYSDFAMFAQAFRHPRLYFPFLGLAPVILMPLIIIGLIITVLSLESPMPVTANRLALTVLLMLGCFFYARHIALHCQLSKEPATDNARYGLLNAVFIYTVQATTDEHRKQVETTLNQSKLAKQRDKFTQLAPPHLFEVFSDAASGVSQTNSSVAPHITVIQSESFFDARRLHPSIKPDVLAQYDACLAQAQQFGTLQVPAWGANTMRTEFAFLTGLEFPELGLYRYYPYQFLHRTPVATIASVLKSLGFYCVCIHPHAASFFGRDKVFPNFGFDAFIDSADFAQAETFGPYVADQAVTDKILSLHEEYHDKLLFIFAITMENHGPLHLEKTTSNEQQRYFTDVPLAQANDLTVYLRHLKNADKMVAQLTHAYTKSNQGRTLCFYGDHVPSMPTVFEALNYTNHDADYFIWQNKAAKLVGEKTNQNQTVKKTINVNDLAETVLKFSKMID